MASVRSWLPSQGSLFTCTPRLGRHRPRGIPSGLRKQQRAAAASVFPVALSAVRGHPSPGRSPRLSLRSRSLPYVEQRALYQRLLPMQASSRMRQVSRPTPQSQLPFHSRLPSFTLSLPFPPSHRGLVLRPLVFRPPSLHVILRLLRRLCLPPPPVPSSTLPW